MSRQIGVQKVEADVPWVSFLSEYGSGAQAAIFLHIDVLNNLVSICGRLLVCPDLGTSFDRNYERLTLSSSEWSGYVVTIEERC